jgi:hypothetical protein
MVKGVMTVSISPSISDGPFFSVLSGAKDILAIRTVIGEVMD